MTNAKTAIKLKSAKPEYPKLRVWWIPQLGMKGPPFYREVKTLVESKLLLETLADYDLYQLKNRIKSDYSNVGGLCYFDPNSVVSTDLDECDGWIDFCNEEGDSISDISFEQLRANTEMLSDAEIVFRAS